MNEIDISKNESRNPPPPSSTAPMQCPDERDVYNFKVQSDLQYWVQLHDLSKNSWHKKQSKENMIDIYGRRVNFSKLTFQND